MMDVIVPTVMDPDSPAQNGRGLAASTPRTAPGSLSNHSLLDSILSTTEAASSALDRFLRERSPLQALRIWVEEITGRQLPSDKRQAMQLLSRDIARIDALLGRQVNAILHHHAFQRLEAGWRGLRYLVEQVQESESVKIRMLSVSWKELVRDLERAFEFDQSQLFRKVYSDEFGMPGGEPYGVLLGDYEIRHRPGGEQPTDDLGAISAISAVAAAAFAPFVAAAHPTFFGLDSFAELEKPLNLPRTFEQLEYVKWKAFRNTEDSRFVGLVLPRILMRLPYADGPRLDRFRFKEELRSREDYLWGNPVYAFGAVLIRAYNDSGWLAEIRGVRRGELGGGLVAGLPVHSPRTDRPGVAPKPVTDGMLTDAHEKELAELGFMPLCYCPDTDLAAFYGTQSVQKPKTYDEPAATANARLSAMLQYILCVARFAHYLKVIARDKLGSIKGPVECEEFLYRWLINYCIANDEVDLETKARYPLREAKVQVRAHPGKPGSYLCVAHLRPHFQLDQLVTSMRLAAELNPGAV